MKEEDIKTLSEVMIQYKESEYYIMLKKQLRIVLDFVERYNKQDKEVEVANAAEYLSKLTKE